MTQTIAPQDYPGTIAGVTMTALTEVNLAFTGYDDNCVILIYNPAAGKTFTVSQDGTAPDEEAIGGKVNAADIVETIAGGGATSELRPSASVYATAAGVLSGTMSAFTGCSAACVRVRHGHWWFISEMEKHVQAQT